MASSQKFGGLPQVTWVKPKRVVVNRGGQGTSPALAESQHGITPVIVFVRNDGWTLGAPADLADVAYRLWSDQWIAYAVRDVTPLLFPRAANSASAEVKKLGHV